MDQELADIEYGGGPYSHPHGHAWTSKVTVRKDDVCRAATDIGLLSRPAGTRIEGMDPKDLTRTGVQKALDPTGTLRSFTVKGVTRGDGRVTVAVLLSGNDGTVGQCYRITRPATVFGTGQPPVTSAPAPSC